MVVVYGIAYNGVHTDVSKTMLGAKQYATRHGYVTVSKRVGFDAVIVAEKLNGKWEDFPLPF